MKSQLWTKVGQGELSDQYEYVYYLSPLIKEALRLYTTDFGEILNQRLTSGELSPNDQEIIKLMDQAFEKSPPINDPLTVYRGIHADEYSLPLSGYLSTSLEKERALQFIGKRCCLLRITVSSGSQILPLEQLSDNPEEREILLPRFGELEVTNKHYQENLLIYDLVYLPRSPPSLSEDWEERILNLISPEELELFGPDVVDMLIQTSLSDKMIPSDIIARVKARLIDEIS